MRVLIACEFSGIVRDAFVALGHDAWSCDLLPSETPGNHFQEDIATVLDFDDEHFQTKCNAGGPGSRYSVSAGRCDERVADSQARRPSAASRSRRARRTVRGGLDQAEQGRR